MQYYDGHQQQLSKQFSVQVLEVTATAQPSSQEPATAQNMCRHHRYNCINHIGQDTRILWVHNCFKMKELIRLQRINSDSILCMRLVQYTNNNTLQAMLLTLLEHTFFSILSQKRKSKWSGGVKFVCVSTNWVGGRLSVQGHLHAASLFSPENKAHPTLSLLSKT